MLSRSGPLEARVRSASLQSRMPPNRRGPSLDCARLAWRVLLALVVVVAEALAPPAAAGELLSVDTRGGLKVGARIIRVTTLADSGAGCKLG